MSRSAAAARVRMYAKAARNRARSTGIASSSAGDPPDRLGVAGVEAGRRSPAAVRSRRPGTVRVPWPEYARRRPSPSGQRSVRAADVLDERSTGIGLRHDAELLEVPAIEASQPARSIAPKSPPPPGGDHVAIVASRMAACVGAVRAELRHRDDRRIEPDVRGRPRSRPSRATWRPMNAAIASRFGVERRRCPRSGRGPAAPRFVDVEHDRRAPVSSSWTGSLFAKPVAASTAPCCDRDALPEIRVRRRSSRRRR